MTISSVAGRWLEGLSRAATGLPAFRRALPLTALAFAVEIVIMVGLRQAFGDIGSQLAILLDATILAVGVFFLSSLIDLYSPSLLALINRQQRLLFCAFLFLTQILTHILIEPLESHLPPGATELLDAALTGAIACIGLSWVLWIDDINAAVGAKTENPANLLSQTSLAMHSMLGVIALIFTLLLTGDFASWLQSTGTARVMNIAGNQRSLGQRLAHLDSMITEEPLRRAQFQPLLESLLDQIELEGRQLKSLIHANSHVWENKTKAMLSRLGELDQARKALIDAVKAELRNGPQSERSLNIHRLSETMLVHSEALVLTLQTFFDEQDHKARTEIFLKAFASYGILVLISLALVSRIVRFISLQAKRQTEVQEKLEASLARFGSYKQAIDQQFIFARTDRAGRIVDVNDRFCAISGYGREELIGRNHRILNSGEHSSGFFKDMWQTIASGRTWTGEICNRAKDGSLYWVRSVVFPLFDAKGRIEQFAAIRTDITDTKKAQKLLHDAVESVPDGFVIYDAGDRLVICNEAYRELYSLAAPAIKEGATFKDILAHGLRCGQFPTVGQTEDERTRWLEERLAEHRQANSDCLQALPDGRWVQIRERKTASGYTVGFRTDVSKLVRQAAVLDTIMQNFPGGIALIDPEFRVVATNEAYRELLELPDTLFENGPPTLETLFRFNAKRGEYGPGEIEDLVQLRLERLQLGLPHLYERQRPDGRVLEVRGAPITGGGYVAAYIDISERREAQQNLWRLANLDSLTGLANRMLFNERLASIIKLAERNKQPFALAVIDLDKFKEINDCHGHDQGDVLLKAVAERLQSAVRDSDTVARLGGDEFALILNKAISQADLRRPLEAIQSAMEVPVEIGGARRICSLSIGVTSYPADGATPTELLKNADIALYRAKAMGRGRVEYYSAEMRRDIEHAALVRRDIDIALTERQFEVYYQPVVRLSDRSVAGMEALLRWRHPSRGLLGPDAFREAFDDAKLMAAIGETVMGLVIPDAARFRQAHGHGLRIAMNVTASDLITGDYLDRLQRRLQAHGLSGDALCIEITEDVFLGRSKETAMETIASLANSGFEIALDDFGTGYASLSHLRLVPVHKLKIDSSFITDMERDPGDLAIVRTIAHLGESLGLDIVAEGVETDSQADLLRLLGVAAMQGYLISQPMPFEEALAFLKAQQSPLTKKPVTVLRA